MNQNSMKVSSMKMSNFNELGYLEYDLEMIFNCIKYKKSKTYL